MPNGPTINNKQCNGCKLCYEICPMDIYIWNSKMKKPKVAYPDECNSCGACELDCPQQAIKITLPAWLRLTYADRRK